ncbi:hypothetical protein GCM10023310_60360 [Paenibacillus vulneris]|uniref:Helix-turn-helix domain-containing protein n=1 Tax=Paenibacillus vulneris TaxID=1133364 RepID=A0ABW3UQD4_9BACL
MRLQRSKKAQTLILMLLLTSLSIAVMGFTVYRIATNTLTQEVQSAYRVSLLRMQDQVEGYFKQIDQAVLQFEKLPALESLASPKTEENNLELLSLLETMLRMQTSLEDVDNIALYRLGTHRLYSTNHQVSTFQDDYAQVIDRFERLESSQAFFSMTVKQTPTTVYVRKLPIFQSSKAFYIIVHLNQKFFDHILGAHNESKGTYFILDEHGSLLQYRGDLSSERLEREIVPIIMKGMPGSEEVFISYLPPSYKGWVFGFAIPASELFMKMNGIRNGIFILAGILLGLAIFVIIFSTNRLWRGWSDIVSLLEDSTPGKGDKGLTDKTLPGKQAFSAEASAPLDEFRQIYDKMQRIKETRDELKEQVRELTPEIREAYIRNMLQKGLRSEEDLEKCRRYHIPLLTGNYGCYCVEIDQYKSMAEIYSEADLYYFRYGLSMVIQEAIDSQGQGVVSAHGDGRFLTLITLEEPASEEAYSMILRSASTVRDFIKQYFPFTVSIGVSRVRKEFAYLSVSAQEAEEALKHKLVAGTNEVIPIAEFQPDGTDGQQQPLPISFRELENDLIYAIRSMDRELAYRYVDSLGSLQGIRTISYQWLQSQLAEMVFSIHRTVGSSLRKPMAEPVMAELMELATLEEWSSWLKIQAIDRLIAGLSDEHMEHMQNVARQLAAYIEEHNEEDLRLESCCKALNLPASIGKQALKEVHDTTFSEFLLQSRIGKAQRWLLETEMSVEEIASRLQYSNAQNFSRTFKKAVGVPPGHYRKAYS